MNVALDATHHTLTLSQTLTKGIDNTNEEVYSFKERGQFSLLKVEEGRGFRSGRSGLSVPDAQYLRRQ